MGRGGGRGKKEEGRGTAAGRVKKEGAREAGRGNRGVGRLRKRILPIFKILIIFRVCTSFLKFIQHFICIFLKSNFG